MSTSTPHNQSDTGLPLGSWKVNPDNSTLEFTAKTFWGLMPVKGRFSEFSGRLEVGADGAAGTLEIQAASLDTQNKKRDEHLRSADFFDVEQHPTITFRLQSAEAEHGHVHLHGTLELPRGEVPLTLHTDAQGGDGSLQLTTGTAISREAAHMTWNQLGMLRGDIVLFADLAFTAA